MAVRRSSSIPCACVFVLALGAFKVANLTFIGSKAATRASKVARYSDASKLDEVPLPAIEADRNAINTGIMDCIEEECSVEALINLDERLAKHEDRIVDAMADVEASKKPDKESLSKEDYTAALAWYEDFVEGMKSVNTELQSARETVDAALKAKKEGKK